MLLPVACQLSPTASDSFGVKSVERQDGLGEGWDTSHTPVLIDFSVNRQELKLIVL